MCPVRRVQVTKHAAQHPNAPAPVANTIHCIQSLLWLAQASLAGVQKTKSWQIALALAMPLFAKCAAAGCARGDASRWRSIQCSMSERPLPHLLMWQMLLIAAATVFMLAAGHGGSAQVCLLQNIIFPAIVHTVQHAAAPLLHLLLWQTLMIAAATVLMLAAWHDRFAQVCSLLFLLCTMTVAPLLHMLI